MNDPWISKLDEAITELEALARKKRSPTRHHARAALVSLGMLLLAEAQEAAQRASRLESATRELQGWDRAVADELSLACTEHAQGVDPRYLDHPRFDFEYVIEARERLEARLRATDQLGITVAEDLLRKVARADAMLAPYLEARGGREAAN